MGDHYCLSATEDDPSPRLAELTSRLSVSYTADNQTWREINSPSVSSLVLNQTTFPSSSFSSPSESTDTALCDTVLLNGGPIRTPPLRAAKLEEARRNLVGTGVG